MEVHAHPHTPRKKWTHYFWEFLMLFRAVFNLGFYQLATRSSSRKAYPDYIELNHQLLKALRKEYHLQ